MPKTTLVTGGAGFIGSHFVEKLFDETDDQILVLDVFTYAASPGNIRYDIRESARFELVRGDVRDERLVADLVGRSDRVVHFAAESHVARSIFADRLFFETDVLGTHSIASAVSSRRGKIDRFVHISTSEVYGTAAYEPMDEFHPLNPCTPYAAAKAGADRLVYAYLETYKIPAVIIRPFNNYGPRQHVEKVIPRFITQAILGEPLTIHGTGDSSRDWVYVGDTCEAVMRALVAPEAVGHVFNVGTGIDISVREVAARVRSIVTSDKAFPGKLVVANVPERPGQVRKHIADTSKARGVLGFDAKMNFWDGLRRTVEWYQENPTWWQRLLPEREAGPTDGGRRLAGAW
jgi:dTDP-glucose 4,6-dehydratase